MESIRTYADFLTDLASGCMEAKGASPQTPEPVGRSWRAPAGIVGSIWTGAKGFLDDDRFS